jgi:hypothetical protein
MPEFTGSHPKNRRAAHSILPPLRGSNQPPSSFPFTVELVPHTTYFSALTTAHGNNFFGPLVSSTPVDETVQVYHLDTPRRGHRDWK